MTDLVWSFAPWLVFLLASRVTSLYGAVAAGVVAAVVVLIRGVGRRRVHMLDVASTVYFVVFGAALIALRPGHLDYWGRYAQAVLDVALTLLVFGSILAGRPFTEAYARETTPESVWHTDPSHSLNRRISTVWGLAFLIGTVSLIAAGSVDVRQFPPTDHRSVRLPLLRLCVHPEAGRRNPSGRRNREIRGECRREGHDLPGYIEASASWRSAQAIALLVAGQRPVDGTLCAMARIPEWHQEDGWAMDESLAHIIASAIQCSPYRPVVPRAPHVRGTTGVGRHLGGRRTRAFGRTPSNEEAPHLPPTATSSPGSMEPFAEYFTALWN